MSDEQQLGQKYLDGQNSVLSDIHKKLYLGEGKSWESITGRIQELHEAEGRAAKLAEENRNLAAERDAALLAERDRLWEVVKAASDMAWSRSEIRRMAREALEGKDGE
jgi:hypothetical protein